MRSKSFEPYNRYSNGSPILDAEKGSTAICQISHTNQSRSSMQENSPKLAPLTEQEQLDMTRGQSSVADKSPQFARSAAHSSLGRNGKSADIIGKNPQLVRLAKFSLLARNEGLPDRIDTNQYLARLAEHGLLGRKESLAVRIDNSPQLAHLAGGDPFEKDPDIYSDKLFYIKNGLKILSCKDGQYLPKESSYSISRAYCEDGNNYIIANRKEDGKSIVLWESFKGRENNFKEHGPIDIGRGVAGVVKQVTPGKVQKELKKSRREDYKNLNEEILDQIFIFDRFGIKESFCFGLWRERDGSVVFNMGKIEGHSLNKLNLKNPDDAFIGDLYVANNLGYYHPDLKNNLRHWSYQNLIRTSNAKDGENYRHVAVDLDHGMAKISKNADSNIFGLDKHYADQWLWVSNSSPDSEGHKFIARLYDALPDGTCLSNYKEIIIKYAEEGRFYIPKNIIDKIKIEDCANHNLDEDVLQAFMDFDRENSGLDKSYYGDGDSISGGSPDFSGIKRVTSYYAD